MKKTMKRLLAMMLVAVMTIGAAPLSGFVGLELPDLGILFAQKAEAATSGTCGENLIWTLDTSTGTLTISGTGDMWDFSYESNRRAPWYNQRSSIKFVIIENGVTSIGDYAFEEHRNLVDIIVSDSVKSIGWYAFEFCVNLKNITIPDSVTSIGSSAFKSSGVYNNNTNWENGVFYIGKHLIEADLSDSDTYKIKDGTINIADYAFNSCDYISKIIFPSSVLSIGDGAFYYCDGLVDVVIPDSVSRIGKYAFGNCKSLESVLIGDGVTTLGENSFRNCPNLNTVIIGNSLTNIEEYSFDECVSLTSVTIGNNVKIISKGAFSDCSSIVSLVIPDSVEQILEYSFNNCTNIASLTIGKGVKFISENAFYDCIALNDIYYTGDIADWCTIAFEGEFPVEHADNIFINGILIEGNLVIPESITSIGDYSFINYSKITQVTIPGSVKAVGVSAFEKCSNLVKVTNGKHITNIGNYAFKECANLQDITLSNNLVNIGEDAFYACTSLKKVTIPDSVTIIGNAAFYECTNLVDLVIGCGVTEIGLYAFAQCEKLKNVTIRSGVKSIGGGAFEDCTSLEKIVIPDSVTNIGEYAFDSCSNLITVTIGNGVTNIGDCAFSCCFNLKNLKVGEALENIGNYAFNSCNNLANINLPDSIKNIGDCAFRLCSSFTNINLPEGLESIGAYVFDGCSGITKITIPSSVTNISELAFESAREILSINVDNNNKFYSNDSYGVLFNKDKSELIKFPEGKIIWEYSIPSSVKIISNNAFSACWYLENGNIYYDGTEAEWNAISIGSNNEPLLNATIHFNATPEGGGEVTPPAEDDYSTQNIKVMSYNVYVKDGNVKGITNGKTYDCSYDTRVRYIIQNIYSNMPDSIGLQELTSDMRFKLENYEDLNGGILLANYTGIGDYRSKSGNNNEASLIYYNKNKFNLKGSGTFWLSESGDKYSTHSASDYPRICTYALLENKETGLRYLHVNTHLEHAVNKKGNSNRAAIFSSEKIIDFVDKKFPNVPVVITGDFNQKKGSAPYNNFIDAGYTDTRNVYSGSLNTYTNCFNQAGEDKKPYDPKVIDHILVNEYFKDGILSYKVYDEDYSDSSKYGNLALDYPYPSDHHPVVVELKANYSGDIILSKEIEFDDYETVEVVFKDEWFEKSNSEYNHSLAQFCSDYVMMGYCYDKDEMKSYLSQMEFDTVDANMSTGRDEVNYFIASKDIVVNGKKETLVFAAFIGSYKNQWYSNFDPYGIQREKSYAGNSEKGKVHLGFADARDYAYSKLKAFITKNNIDKENMKLLLSGHSRGAATANLLAAKLIDETYTNSSTSTVNRNSIYTYTFATPNTTNAVSGTGVHEKYYSIKNIVNPEDFVTKVLPNSWGYSRYGKTYVLPSRTNDKNWKLYLKAMNKCFAQYKLGEVYDPYNDGEKTTYKIVEKFTKNINNLNEFYEKDIWAYNFSTIIPVFMKPYDFFKDSLLGYLSEQNKAGGLNLAVAILLYGKTVYQDMIAYFFNPDLLIDASLNPGIDPGGKFKQAHGMETYTAYMNAMTESQITILRSGYKNTVNCPVDIEIYDNATNELVGKITNNVINETVAVGENATVMDVDGDSKSFWLPSNGDYRVVLTGNDDGTMDYSVSEIGSDTGETERVNFFNVEIENGVSMEGEINADEFVLDEYTLTHEENGAIKPTEILEEDELKDISISVTTEGIGYTDGNITVTSGDYVTLNASTDEGNSFVGWYENGVLVSSDSAYSFVAKENRALVARFTNNRIVVWDVDGETSVMYVKPGEAITVPENPVKQGYTFIGWTPSIPSVMPDEDLTFTAVFKENQPSFSATCPDCGQTFTDEIAFNNHLETHKTVSVSVINGTVIGGELKPGATITIKAEQIDGKVFKQWVVEGAKAADKNLAETTVVLGTGEITITAEYDDCECNCHKGGITAFFFKIILFFQKLFGKNVECPCGAKH